MRVFKWNATVLNNRDCPSPIRQWEIAVAANGLRRLQGPLHVRPMNLPTEMVGLKVAEPRVRMYQVSGVIE